MAERISRYLALFAFILSLVFGVAAVGLYHISEDRAYGDLLNQLVEEKQSVIGSSYFYHTIDELPEKYRNAFSGLPPGRHELHWQDWEIHAQINPDHSIALIEVPDAQTRERQVVTGIWIAVGITTLLGWLFGMWLVKRIVQPLEALVAWLKAREHTTTEIGLTNLPDKELNLLANTIERYFIDRERQNERERLFLQEASHELRTPVSVIKGIAELANDGPLSNEAIARLTRSSNRMEHTIEGLLCLARKDQSIKLVDFDQEVKQLIEEFREQAKGGVQVKFETSWIPTDPLAARMIYLCLATLLCNVRDHAQATEVTISLSESALIFMDNGQGIQDFASIRDHLDRQLPLPSGGLGLSMVTRICRRLNWKYTLQALDPGFCVRLDF